MLNNLFKQEIITGATHYLAHGLQNRNPALPPSKKAAV